MDHSKHEGKHTAAGGEIQANRFEADMDAGMARMMQDMHSPGYTGQPAGTKSITPQARAAAV